MINSKPTVESRIANLEKMLKNNFKYRVNEEFDDDDFIARTNREENEEIIAELAIFKNVINALSVAKINLDKLYHLNYDQYGADEDNCYYSDMADECSRMISKLTNSADNLESLLNPV